MRFDVSNIPDTFSVEAQNQYEAIAAVAEEMSPMNFGRKQRKQHSQSPKHIYHGEEWISEETVELLEKRRSMREEGVNIAGLEYHNATKDIKRVC